MVNGSLSAGYPPPTSVPGYDLPSGALQHTLPRSMAGTGTLALLTSGTLLLTAIPLAVGQTVTSITFVSGTTAASSSTHVVFSLWNASRVRLGISADDTAASPWSASTAKTMSLTTPYQATASGLYYIGVMVAAGTPPTLRGTFAGAGATVNALAPILTGTADAGLTDPASHPSTATTITAITSSPYGYVS